MTGYLPLCGSVSFVFATISVLSVSNPFLLSSRVRLAFSPASTTSLRSRLGVCLRLRLRRLLNALGPRASKPGALGPEASRAGALGPEASRAGAFGPGASTAGTLGPRAPRAGAPGPRASRTGALAPGAPGPPRALRLGACLYVRRFLPVPGGGPP